MSITSDKSGGLYWNEYDADVPSSNDRYEIRVAKAPVHYLTIYQMDDGPRRTLRFVEIDGGAPLQLFGPEREGISPTESTIG